LRDLAADRFAEALKLLSQGATLDLERVNVDSSLLKTIKEALPRKSGRAQFNDKTSFYRTRFGTETDFRDAVLGHNANFVTRFRTEADFRDVVFGHNANFVDARFISASFRGASFGDNAHFGAAKFLQKADFFQTTFGNWANFISARFGPGAFFGEATFGESAWIGATFGEGANFTKATFGDRAHISGAFGEGASFEDAKFSGFAFLSELNIGKLGNFQGTTFQGASFQSSIFGPGTSFHGANLEGLDLTKAVLGGVDLTEARLDYRTNLKNARLFTREDGSVAQPRTRLADVRWNGASVAAIADWNVGPPRVGEDPHPDWPGSGRKSDADSVPDELHYSPDWFRHRRQQYLWEKSYAYGHGSLPFPPEPPNLADAVRTYRQLATMLRSEGLVEEARRFDYRASQVDRRRSPPDAKRWPGWLRWLPWLSWGLRRTGLRILDITSRYGYAPERVFVTYLATVGLFAVIYGALGVTPWINAFWFSLIAFHGRGVISANITPEYPWLLVPAIEAALGLLVEALFVATLIRRLFRN
jgi:uncharacterized protein YjbI with pentapeptide repeats